VGIGAPVLKSGGEILGTLLITIPAFRFDPGAEARLAELVKRQALRIAPCLAGAALPQPMLQESAS
jgi:DNA-binding IclR family transcriptional regulator